MRRIVLNAARVLGLALTVAGCKGYGDEIGAGSGSRPPLILIKDVNAFLAEFQKRTGTVPQTYEELVQLYEQTGKSFPPFTDGGSWVYFPHRARVIEVRQTRVRAYLEDLNAVIETSRFFHSPVTARRAIRQKRGVSVDMPGYLIGFETRGTQVCFTIEYEEDEVTPKRGNHTATKDFDINLENQIVAVLQKPDADTPGGFIR